MSSNCDKVIIEKTYSNDGPIIKMALLDLAELGNKEFVAGIPVKKFEFETPRVATAKRFAKFNGKKVKEVFTFTKDVDGTLKSVSLKRFKKSFVRYTYPLGGIICRAN